MSRSLWALVALSLFSTYVVGSSVAAAQAAPTRRAARARRCPSGFEWSADANACVGQRTCPAGFRLDESMNCTADALSCPEGSSLVDGRCQSDTVVCPAGTTELEGTCVREPSCPEGTRADGDRCVRPSVCPAGTTYDAVRGCIPPEAPTLRLGSAPTCASPVHVEHEKVGFEARAGLGYGLYARVDDGSAPVDEPAARGGFALRVGAGMTRKSLALAAHYTRIFSERRDFSQLTLELGARCACWSERYEWQIGIEGGYDFARPGVVASIVHVSRLRLRQAFFVGIDARASSVIGYRRDEPTYVGGSLMLLLGYSLGGKEVR